MKKAAAAPAAQSEKKALKKAAAAPAAPAMKKARQTETMKAEAAVAPAATAAGRLTALMGKFAAKRKLDAVIG